MLCPARTYRSVLECGYIKVNQNDPRVRPFYAPVICCWLRLPLPSRGWLTLIAPSVVKL